MPSTGLDQEPEERRSEGAAVNERGAPIALGAERERQEEARAWFAAEAAAGRLPEQEKKPRP